MNLLGSKLKHHLNVYRHFLSFAIKYMVEYRLNFLIRSLHNVTYVGMFFITTIVIYAHTESLGGWNIDQALILFSLTNFSFSIQSFIFMRGVEEFMREKVKNGTLDFDLLKPVNTQFMALLRTPWVDSILLGIIMLSFFIHQLIKIWAQISLLNLGLFIISYILCSLIWYFILSSYATLAFYVTRAQQVMYFIEKASDFSQYPTHIFPKSVQWIFFSIVPIALFAYLPASILLGNNSLLMWKIIGVLLPISFIVNKLAWREGLKRYSSASS